MGKSDKIEMSQTMPQVVLVAPVHMKTMSEICATFGKKRDTVKKWYAKGAPIAYDGAQYSAEYNQLMAWLVHNFSKKV